MRLAELPLDVRDSVVRDAEIDALGFLNAHTPRTLAPLGAAKYLAELADRPNVAAVICPAELAGRIPERLALIVSDDPVESLFRLHCRLHAAGFYERDSASSLGAGCYVHPSAVVAERNVVIGERCHIGPGVIIEPGTRLGDDVVLGPGVALGGNGFEVRVIDGERRVVPHVGGVALGNRVELQTNTSVSRSLFAGATSIGDETATDNLVHIAHNVTIGKRCRLAACAMVAGSVTIGDDVWIGPNATISNSIEIGDGAEISLGAVVIRSVPPGMKVSGHFALEHRTFMKFFRSILTAHGKPDAS